MQTVNKVLFTEDHIKLRVAEMGKQIVSNASEGGLVVVGILKGSFLFLADLVRQMPGIVNDVHFIQVQSYEGTERKEHLEFTSFLDFEEDFNLSFKGKNVLLVDDILDTGRTLSFVQKHISEARGMASLRTTVLLDKPARRELFCPVEYVGFQIEDNFVVGYGMDYNGLYRNLPDIRVYEE